MSNASTQAQLLTGHPICQDNHSSDRVKAQSSRVIGYRPGSYCLPQPTMARCVIERTDGKVSRVTEVKYPRNPPNAPAEDWPNRVASTMPPATRESLIAAGLLNPASNYQPEPMMHPGANEPCLALDPDGLTIAYDRCVAEKMGLASDVDGDYDGEPGHAYLLDPNCCDCPDCW